MISTIEQLVIQLGETLKKQQLKIVTAESCTGGGLAYWMTNVPKSSEWFERGFVTYSNLAKEELLGVRSDTLLQFGAVSQEVAAEMAEGALRYSEANVSVAITGIAGPDGVTEEKPVGTVWIACTKIQRKTKTTKNIFSGNRQAIREQSMRAALEMLLAFI